VTSGRISSIQSGNRVRGLCNLRVALVITCVRKWRLTCGRELLRSIRRACGSPWDHWTAFNATDANFQTQCSTLPVTVPAFNLQPQLRLGMTCYEESEFIRFTPVARSVPSDQAGFLKLTLHARQCKPSFGSPNRSAAITSSAREVASILRIAFPRWIFTVISLMPTKAAICLFNSPETTNCMTSRSRGVSE